MNPTTMSIVISSLALGTTITLSSHHWLLAWMGLEINTLAIIPMMAKQHHPRAIEATTKYFITQAVASSLILFSSINNAWVTGEWSIINLTNTTSVTTMTIALSIKMGLAPFHFWLPEVLQGINMTTGLVLSTWQKLAPMALIYQISSNLNPTILLTLGLLSTLVGAWGGINQTQLRKIMAFSSIAHLGWMVAISSILPQLMLLNLAIYLIMTSMMFLSMKTLMTTNMSTLSMLSLKSPTMAAACTITLLSLGGLPPLSGFMPKWLIIQELVNQNATTLATMMAMSALLSLFFYLRLSYTISLTSSPNTSNSNIIWYQSMQNPTMTSASMILSIMLLPITPLIVNLL
uniref:NADH-ubiquinone oxidoreductase chain 2 n=1 Tax=Pseudhymenochirus merlini TaxID=864177 RepID=F6KDB9_9PIPI|nr:NADH dehydrogenase subunit 2 [Pseudhymenochirus merlini]ADM35697.1 NADH dehydrogenase subunit 2 [Pseudhymenochirus merlini]